MYNLVSYSWNRLRQNKLINILSGLLIIEVGIPCRRTMLLTNALATITAVKGCFKGTKWAYFVNRSTTTMMTVYPLKDGNPSMKSIKMSVHIYFRMDSGCSSPVGLILSALYQWQMSQFCKNSFTVRLILDHKKLCLMRPRVLWYPKCPPTWDEWQSETILGINDEVGLKYTLSRLNQIPSLCSNWVVFEEFLWDKFV